MDAMFTVVLFVLFLLILEMLHYALSAIRNPEAVKVRERLKSMPAYVDEAPAPDIVRREHLSDIPWLNRLLLAIPGMRRFNRLVGQANTGHPAGFYLLLSLVLAAIGYLIGTSLVKIPYSGLLSAVLLFFVPVLILMSRRKQRMEKFQRQLPEALDLVSRALKAGHAFSGGMKMVADEMDDPIGPEFDKTLDEINFGVSVADALKNLAARVACPDLSYFVVAVLIQRESGGNLADLIASITHLIRERFKLYGRIRVLSAEGRASAIILIAIPIFVAVALVVVSRDYIATLGDDPIGRVLIGIAVGMMIFGVLVMRKMIRIDV